MFNKNLDHVRKCIKKKKEQGPSADDSQVERLVNCPICGGDMEVGNMAKRMGYRPDAAFARANRMQLAIDQIAPWLSASLEENVCKEYEEAVNEVLELGS